jgi:hypothetical protein
VIQSLQGNWREDVLFELQQVVEGYDFYQRQMAGCDRQLQKYLAVLPDRKPNGDAEAEEPAAETGLRSGGRRRGSGKTRAGRRTSPNST